MSDKTISLPDGGHARLSASSSHRWTLCPGSVSASEGVPRAGSLPAATGTVAHHVAAEYLSLVRGGSISLLDYIGRRYECDGFVIEVDAEMLEAVKVYTDYCEGHRANARSTAIEQDLTPALRELDPDFGGQADFVAVYDDMIEVVDYKHGSGVAVDPEENTQLMYYAIGAYLSLNARCPKVKITVVQPRMSGEAIKSWGTAPSRLLELAGELVDQAAMTREESPTFTAGDHCRFCPALATCPVAAKYQDLILSDDFDVIGTSGPPAVLTPEKLGKALDLFPLIEARIAHIRELAYTLAQRGEDIPGHKLVYKQARLSWVDDLGATQEFVKLLGQAALKEPTLKTPTQISKLLGKEYQDVLDQYAQKVSSGTVLVPDSDRRPAVQSIVEADFDNITS